MIKQSNKIYGCETVSRVVLYIMKKINYIGLPIIIKDFLIYLDVIKNETLATSLVKKELDVESSNLNGIEVKFDVEKIK